MAINTYPSTGQFTEPKWETVATASPSSVSSVIFSNLSGYNRYRLVMSFWQTSANAALVFRFNGDTTGSAYYYSQGEYGPANGTTSRQAFLNSNNDGIFTPVFLAGYYYGTTFDITDASSTTAPKFLSGTNVLTSNNFGSSLTTQQTIQGVWKNTAPITSITVSVNSGVMYAPVVTNNFMLLGAN